MLGIPAEAVLSGLVSNFWQIWINPKQTGLENVPKPWETCIKPKVKIQMSYYTRIKCPLITYKPSHKKEGKQVKQNGTEKYLTRDVSNMASAKGFLSFTAWTPRKTDRP